ncbi:MAG: hypothetical protein KDF59_05785 [Nitrosomonas sp.]|nr:hypothetical protein [Nitrosomonas sp.]
MNKQQIVSAITAASLISAAIFFAGTLFYTNAHAAGAVFTDSFDTANQISAGRQIATISRSGLNNAYVDESSPNFPALGGIGGAEILGMADTALSDGSGNIIETPELNSWAAGWYIAHTGGATSTFCS